MTQSSKVSFTVLKCHNDSYIGVASLNKPAALNALDSDMIELLSNQLTQWQDAPHIAMVLLDSELDKAFCAGGDVVTMYHAMRSNTGDAAPLAVQDFFTHEYQLDYLIHHYRKPLLVWGHGIVMGGGLGLMAGASHRIVTQTSRIAMPEITIGLYPDVGGSYFLNTMPAGCGLFLGLSGASINATDALYCQLADYVMAQQDKPAFLQALCAIDWQSEAQANHQLLSALCLNMQTQDVLPPANLIRYQPLFNELASCLTVEAVEQCILSCESAQDSWFSKAQKTLQNGSPISKHLVFEQLQRGQDLSLADCFKMELVMSCRCASLGEFEEGVRALLVDKDNTPQWLYPCTEAVPREVIEAFFVSPWPAEQHPLASLGADLKQQAG